MEQDRTICNPELGGTFDRGRRPDGSLCGCERESVTNGVGETDERMPNVGKDSTDLEPT
jgi:hypothetical protein